MAYPSYTYNLTNGTPNNAAQVQQNFTDVRNGIIDGTKDLNVNKITTTNSMICGGDMVIVGTTTFSAADTLLLHDSFVTVGTGGQYSDINAAVAAGKYRIALISDITVTSQQEFTLTGGMIVGNNYKINCATAMGGSDAILRISNDTNTVRDIQIFGLNIAGNISKGFAITSACCRNQCYGIKIFQNGAGTMDCGLYCAGNYNQIDAIIQTWAGTITAAKTDAGTFNDIRTVENV